MNDSDFPWDLLYMYDSNYCKMNEKIEDKIDW
jgi:hypothetical protein